MRNEYVRAQLRAVQSQTHVVDDDDAIAGVDGFKPLVPDGWYEARYLGHETGVVFMASKVFLHFEITQGSDFMGTRLFRAFRVRKLTDRPRKGGKFVLHAGSDLYVLMCRLLDVKLRTDRITFRPLRAMLFRIRTRTVTTNHQQKEKPEHARYSVVSEIEREQ